MTLRENQKRKKETLNVTLTLFQIEEGLLQLIQYRQERLLDAADPPSEEEIATLDAEIDKYQFAEPVKVGRVAAIFRMWRALQSNMQAEVTRLTAMIAALKAMEERLKGRVAMALELLPMPAKGCRKLNGVEGRS